MNWQSNMKNNNQINKVHDLRDFAKQTVSQLSFKKLKNTMPTIAEIEAELNALDNKNQEDKNAKNKN